MKQKHDEQIKEQIALLGGFKSKSTYDDFKRLAEMAGYKTRHFCDVAKGHSKLSDERCGYRLKSWLVNLMLRQWINNENT